MSHYTNHSIQIQDDADGSPTTIGSLSDVGAPIEADVQQSETGGTYYPENVSIAALKPRCNFTSFDLPKVWTALGLVGRSVEEGVGKPGFALLQAKYNDSSISAGSTHRRLRMAKAYIGVTRISVAHQQDAQIECQAQAIYDGSNKPILIEGSQALPTLPSNPGRWTIASITVGGVSIPCNVRIDLDTGLRASLFGCDSEIYDSHLNLDSIQPRIAITSLDPETFADAVVPLDGLDGTHANSSIVLRKRLEGPAGFVADATAEHIEITTNGTIICPDPHSGTGNQRVETRLEIYPRYDGTNAPVILDSAYAIP